MYVEAYMYLWSIKYIQVLGWDLRCFRGKYEREHGITY